MSEAAYDYLAACLNAYDYLAAWRVILWAIVSELCSF